MSKEDIEKIFNEINHLIFVFAEMATKERLLIDSDLDSAAFSMFASKDIEGLTRLKKELEIVVKEAQTGQINVDNIIKITEHSTIAA